MTQDEFLKCIVTSKKLIDDAMPFINKLSIEDFMENYEKIKYNLFSDYSVECIESQAFKTFIIHMMGLVNSLEKNVSYKGELPENVIKLSDYRTVLPLRLFG